MVDRNIDRSDQETQRQASSPNVGDREQSMGAGRGQSQEGVGAMGSTSSSGGYATDSGWNEASGGLRKRWEERYGQSGADWNTVEPGYRYGYEMANNPRYQDREWTDVESDFRSNYGDWATKRGYQSDDSAWDQLKDGVRDAWQHVRSAMKH